MSEIYIEGRFKMPVVNTDEFGYDEEEVKKLDWEDFAKDEFWNSCDDMGELEDKYDITFHKVQPQLTIPKNIAKKIDKFIKVLHFLNEFEAIKFLSAMDLNGDRTPQWLKDNPMLVFAYLSGKALGVDLVKVV
ncbi:hypothetical protein [Lactococcus lactis]|uniref:Uncharacterized protein n=1 Tax=Lactococcus lactis subsp. lactis TaxID=1360 RepID=A0A1V0P0Z5_LACLL|nr:hypothetical protein [Lactococcus lactis]ARE20482.1 hypothetical protein LLUC06_0935 [Lactococcus lactis subsp. lactis]